MSPAKLALRRHLSQERLSSSHLTSSERSTIDSRQSSNYDNRHVASGTGLLGTRTIGDLVSGEIERTLEISNQSIINATVDMSAMIRPETVYSPISRPASAEGDAGLSTLAHVASYAPTSSGTSISTPTTSSRSSVLFTPVTQPQRYIFFHSLFYRTIRRNASDVNELFPSDIHRFNCRERILSLTTSLTFRIIRLSRSRNPIQRHHLYIHLKVHRMGNCYL